MNIDVYIDKQLLNGWYALNIKSSIENATYLLSMKVIDEAPFINQNVSSISIKSTSIIEVVQVATPISSPETIYIGFIDRFNVKINDKELTIDIESREKTADIIDSQIEKAKEIKEKTLLALAKELCEPFNIPVKFVGHEGKPIKKIVLEEGAGVYDTIEEYARNQGFLVRSNGLGELIIEKPQNRLKAGTIIKEGVNIVSCEIKVDQSNRFSDYIVKASIDSVKSEVSVFDKLDGKENKPVMYHIGISKDNNMKRYRRKVILSESIETKQSIQERANWQRSVNASRSESIVIKTTTWLKDNLRVWRVNELVPVVTTFIGVNGEYLIKECELDINQTDMSVNLTLVPENAYTLEPSITLKPKKTTESSEKSILDKLNEAELKN